LPDTSTVSQQDLDAALPDVTSRLSFAALDGAVTVYRDAQGIPHIKATAAHDAFFGQGFATAQDRLFQMDHDRRWAYGRWAEFAGESAVEQDTLMRKFRLRHSAEEDYDAVNEETREMFDAYAEGVNAFIESTATLPVEYKLLDTAPEPWTPQDCIAVYKARHVLMGHMESKLWRAKMVAVFGAERAAELMPQYEKGGLLIVPPGDTYLGDNYDVLHEYTSGAEYVDSMADADSGSNNWAVHGSRTASGKPLVAGDPHRPLETPSVYYQNHIACDEFDAMGLSFPGCPAFPHFGHNASVAWCVTHASADYQDLYLEKFRAGSTTHYEYQDKWKHAETHREVIQVKDANPVEIDVTTTHHGPIVVGDPTTGRAISFKYTATDGPSKGLEPLLRQLHSQSVDEMDAAMRGWVDPCNNYVFGDIHGDISYLTRGKIPVRTMANAWLPVPGWTGEHEWRGFIPFEELPRIRNPENGFLVTANNKQVGDDYPHYISVQYATEHRARRIYDRLIEMPKATVEDMAAVHAESVSLPARAYLKLLQDVEPRTDRSADARRILLDWDGTMDASAAAPAIFSAFRYHLDDKILRHLLGSLADYALGAGGRGAPAHVGLLKAQFARMAEADDTSFLPPGTDWKTLMAEALQTAVEYLTNRMGDDMSSWTWGAIHQTSRAHWLSNAYPWAKELEGPPMSLSGDGDTPLSSSYSHADPFAIAGTSVARYIYDLSDWDNSRWIVPLGASGHPASEHFADQAETWSKVDSIPMTYSWDDITANAETSQKLTNS
jgi:penicillin amidase